MDGNGELVLSWGAGIFAVFALAIAAGGLFRRDRLRDVWTMYAVQLLTTSWVLVPAWFGGIVFQLVITITALLASRELLEVLRRIGPVPGAAPVLVTVAATCAVAAFALDPFWLIVPPLAFFLVALAAPVFGAPLEGSYARASAGLAVCFYPGLCAASAMRIEWLGNLFGDFAFLYAVAELNDACAFLGGRVLGKRRHVPVLSPNKTLAGAVLGLIGATVAGAALVFLLADFDWWAGALLGFAIGSCTQVADLAASAIKRQAGVKDFASAIATQGGVLDVYDALLFQLPAWYLALRLLR